MNKPTLAEVAVFISEASRVELESIHSMTRGRWSALTMVEARKFYVGQEVTFTGKRGFPLSGKITKINQKSVKVDVNENGRMVHWKVSPSLLKVAA